MLGDTFVISHHASSYINDHKIKMSVQYLSCHIGILCIVKVTLTNIDVLQICRVLH